MLSHSVTKETILSQFKTDEQTGLSEAAAADLLKEYGENRLEEKKKRTWLQMFIAQFKDVMIIILLAAALVSFVTAVMEQHTYAFFEPFLILTIVLLNAFIGVAQESKAEKSLEALQNMSAPHAKVIREGQEKLIEARKLVPGDVIKLEAGDFIPADARLLTDASLKSEESALTGESVPADKDAEATVEENAALGDRYNMVYSGCSITYGRGTAVVVNTGMNTEIGKIAGLLNSHTDTQTPLQQKLTRLGKYLGYLALAICLVIFIIGLLSGMPIMEIFMLSVSLAVSAIPEGLPVIVTVVLSIGVGRMAERNAIVKRLPAVETLGSTSVICSDKTGTLTQNKMTLITAYTEETGTQEDMSEENSPPVRELLTFGVLCCDGTIQYEDEKEIHMGDPTETSIVDAAHNNNIHQDDVNHLYKRVAEIPFDSDRKLMTTIHEMEDRYIVITKGAFDVLADKCISGDIKKAEAITKELSARALRVLAIAWKEIEQVPEAPSPDSLENGLTFKGLVGMIDPPRAEAKEAVRICKKAGIKPVMITGDHVITASAIARELGILEEGGRAVSGMELAALPDTELEREIETISVYARVSPEDKIRVVRTWQKKQAVVAMTGDGVNDAPALKAADIGCAMGITGTDVAKDAADMTLMDDNFATIVEAVKEGRGIYDNIKKTIAFLLVTNVGEVLLIVLSMLIWRETPLLSMQLLLINLATDSLPAIALGMEPIESDVMARTPRPKAEGIFAGGLGIQVVWQGLMFGLLALAGFRIAWLDTNTLEGGRTLAFLVMALSQVVHAFNSRSSKSIFKIGLFGNLNLNKATLVSLVIIILVLTIPPAAAIFGMTMLPLRLYGTGIALSFVPVVVIEIAKTFQNARS